MRYAGLPWDSKVFQFWRKYMQGKMKHAIRKMNKKMFEKGGAWDKFSGKDGVLQFEEAKKMNQAIKAATSKKLGEDVPDYQEGQFKKIYDAYNKLSPDVDGFTKEDAKTAQKIMNKIRHKIHKWMPSKEMFKEFKPLFTAEEARYEDLDDDSKIKKFWQRYRNGRAHKDIHEMNRVMFAKGGPWDKFSGKDGVM